MSTRGASQKLISQTDTPNSVSNRCPTDGPTSQTLGHQSYSNNGRAIRKKRVHESYVCFKKCAFLQSDLGSIGGLFISPWRWVSLLLLSGGSPRTDGEINSPALDNGSVRRLTGDIVADGRAFSPAAFIIFDDMSMDLVTARRYNSGDCNISFCVMGLSAPVFLLNNAVF